MNIKKPLASIIIASSLALGTYFLNKQHKQIEDLKNNLTISQSGLVSKDSVINELLEEKIRTYVQNNKSIYNNALQFAKKNGKAKKGMLGSIIFSIDAGKPVLAYVYSTNIEDTTYVLTAIPEEKYITLEISKDNNQIYNFQDKNADGDISRALANPELFNRNDQYGVNRQSTFKYSEIYTNSLKKLYENHQ